MFVCRRRLFSTASVLRNTDAALGLRSQRPPDTQPDPKTPPEISDHEWELRTGRAIHILQQTLPEFFETGLITSSSDGLRPILGSVVGAPAPNDLDSIYSPNIRLSYTPPGNLPPPLPKTLHIEGISMYLASSVFVRHTMNAVYSETRVALNKVAVESRGGKKSREKSLVVGLTASGVARVSGAASEWEVNSTYTFSPLTGLIHIHTVNSIHPAPHQAVYDALRFNVFSGSGREQGPAANTTAKDS